MKMQNAFSTSVRWTILKLRAIWRFELQNQRENIWANKKFEGMSSHVVLSLSQQFWAILRYMKNDI